MVAAGAAADGGGGESRRRRQLEGCEMVAERVGVLFATVGYTIEIIGFREQGKVERERR